MRRKSCTCGIGLQTLAVADACAVPGSRRGAGSRLPEHDSVRPGDAALRNDVVATDHFQAIDVIVGGIAAGPFGMRMTLANVATLLASALAGFIGYGLLKRDSRALVAVVSTGS